MAPVVTTISTTGKSYLTSARAGTEVGMMIQQSLVDWITAINEPDEIALLGGYNTATTWSTNPFGLMVGVNKSATGNQYQHGVFFNRFNTVNSYLYTGSFYNWTGLSSANNGYGSYDVDWMTSNDNNQWWSGDGVTIRIIYNADPGDQYWVYSDTVNSNPTGIFRVVRPAGPNYPSKAYVSDFVALGGSTSPSKYLTLTNGGAASTGYGFTSSTSNFNMLPVDNYYLVSGGPVFTRSLYLGNKPPGLGMCAGLAIHNTLSNGTEVWRNLGRGLTVREVL